MLELSVEQHAPVALNAVLQCEAGKMLALVGPSGAGKTTLLKMIAGLTHPPAGSIYCEGEAWIDTSRGIRLSPQQRKVGYVFQQYALFPHLTAVGNIEQACRHLPPAQRRDTALHWLGKVNLAGLENRRPSGLSGGQQQRVGLARALAREPNVLLLDEPFSAVDFATRERLYRELAVLRSELAIPSVLVTHDLNEARLLADHICMLSQGRTLQSGAVSDVISRPATVLVARLVGFRNIFRGTLISHTSNGSGVIEWRGHRLEVTRTNGFEVGQPVHWCIPQSHVVLHRRERPSRGERENPLHGDVTEVLSLGDNQLIAVQPGSTDRPPVYLSVPEHVAARNELRPGVRVGLSLLADSIHLMPPDRIGRSRR
ncbi:MAG: ABC transporter ATP-binding protein [Pseudomonadota bacterium]